MARVGGRWGYKTAGWSATLVDRRVRVRFTEGTAVSPGTLRRIFNGPTPYG